MNSRLAKLLLLTLGLWVMATMIWPGCATVPVTTRREPVLARQKKDFKTSRRIPLLTREQVVTRLGAPDAACEDIHVAIYKVSRLNRRELVLFLGLLPLAFYPIPEQAEIACFEFDATGHVLRSGFAVANPRAPLEEAARRWQKAGAKPAQ